MPIGDMPISSNAPQTDASWRKAIRLSPTEGRAALAGRNVRVQMLMDTIGGARQAMTEFLKIVFGGLKIDSPANAFQNVTKGFAATRAEVRSGDYRQAISKPEEAKSENPVKRQAPRPDLTPPPRTKPTQSERERSNSLDFHKVHKRVSLPLQYAGKTVNDIIDERNKVNAYIKRNT